MADKKKTNPIVNYFKEVKGEMKKVAWPTFKQVRNNTFIVIVCIVVVGLFIALLDFGFGKGFELIMGEDAATEQVETPSDIVIDDVQLDGEAVEVEVPDAGENDGE